jgi:hypothetical protein
VSYTQITFTKEIVFKKRSHISLRESLTIVKYLSNPAYSSAAMSQLIILTGFYRYTLTLSFTVKLVIRIFSRCIYLHKYVNFRMVSLLIISYKLPVCYISVQNFCDIVLHTSREKVSYGKREQQLPEVNSRWGCCFRLLWYYYFRWDIKKIGCWWYFNAYDN